MGLRLRRGALERDLEEEEPFFGFGFAFWEEEEDEGLPPREVDCRAAWALTAEGAA